MANLTQQGDTFIKSNEPADNGRGQNGDKTPVSVKTAPPPIKNVAPPEAAVPASDWQTRKVDASPLPPAHGMLHRQMHKKL
jgi:hypothetical protein